jgi:hypothetical protein
MFIDLAAVGAKATTATPKPNDTIATTTLFKDITPPPSLTFCG